MPITNRLSRANVRRQAPSVAFRIANRCAHRIARHLPRVGRFVLCLALSFGLADCLATAAAPPLLTPPPRDVTWTATNLDLTNGVLCARQPEEQQVARLLAAELRRRHHLDLPDSSAENETAGPAITLALADSPHGQQILQQVSGWASWPPPRNRADAYVLEVEPHRAVIVAETQRGLVYGCQTLLQLVRSATSAGGSQLAGVRISDYPQLAFRGVHICIFPNTELAAVRQMILLAARFKLNAVVIEPWASLQSRKRPESAYDHAYRPEQIRPLIQLGHALGLEMIPMLNSWGHASGMRSRSGEHVVLDRYPKYRDLYEPDGWSFRLSNPAIYDHLFDRYDELLELFAPVHYFHLGLDEAWGHLGPDRSGQLTGDEALTQITRHLHKLYGYFHSRDIRVLMWHDMFLERDHPELGRQSPANSVPPFNTHRALPQLPRDVIIAAWNYSAQNDWPVPKYFHDRGFPVVVCPWKTKGNTIALINTAKQHDLLGMLATTWDSLDVCQPSVGRAGVLAWTAPQYDLGQVPFDHWLQAIRDFPITALPQLEETLATEPPER